MKKTLILLLLIITATMNGQVSTGQEQEFDYGIKNNASQAVTSANYIVTQGLDGTYGKIDPSMISGEVRIAVNDVSYNITGAGNKIIAYTNITADRTVLLPLANTANQRIWITDESGMCSNARRIIVQPNGTDVIGGDAFSVINFPNGSGLLESNGAGKWNIISTTAIQFSAGVNTTPTVTDNGNGSVTLGTGVYSLFANADGVGRPKAYQLAGGTYTFVDGSTNYIYANYNTTTGVVSLQQTTTESPLNDLTQILVYAAYRQGTVLHPRNFDRLGIALANKLNRSIYRTQRVRFEEGGVLIGESAIPAVRTITISAGTVWVGAAEQALSALTSAANTCYHVIQTSPGVWTTSTVVTQYNNTQYNTTAGLQTLNNNEYGVNWVYRSIGTDNDMAIILGGASYTLGQAQTSPKPTNLPIFMRHMELIGRIIVLKNATTATQIDNVSSTFFTAAGVTDHNALNNLQTAQSGVTYGHITDAAQAIAGVKSVSNSASTATNSFEFINNFNGGSTVGDNAPLKVKNNLNGIGIHVTNSNGGIGEYWLNQSNGAIAVYNSETASTGDLIQFTKAGLLKAKVDQNSNFFIPQLSITGLAANYIPITGALGLIGNSPIYLNGNNIGVNTTSANSLFQVDNSNSGIATLRANSTSATYASTLIYGSTLAAGSSSFNLLGLYANSVPKFLVDGNGAINSAALAGQEIALLQTDTAGNVSRSTSTFTSGSYSPTVSSPTNATSTSVLQATYTQIGNLVTVFVRFQLTETAASTSTSFKITLPVNRTSSGTSPYIGSGSKMNIGSGSNTAVKVFFDGTNNSTATIFYITTSEIGSTPGSVSFQYLTTE